ncbi:hypothetical protein BXY41_11790 [Lacrimispora xylanisolvens]|uniref:Uncharacterized protein n=1 Tax=Lacrimispora xylanisolvens TaxID=384636 RepID=A0A2S6HHK6_9FIRM|nr:hypothetical protein [Hungatella xylanolytica]PPK76861.1 hypothetical protein BXY41_11790 [Hungatella xylanolytica]
MEISGLSGSSSYDQLQELQLQKEKEKKAAEQAAAESAQITASQTVTDAAAAKTVSGTSQRVDTIEISQEGRAYQQKMQGPPPPKDSNVTEAASTEASGSSTVLTGLTEEEISKLVDKGTITQAEANAELARRTALKEAQDNQETSNTGTEYIQIDEEE